MASLNQIADEIGDALDRPKDWMFKERIKAIFRHEAATIVRQAIDKDGLTDQFKTRYNVTIGIVDDSSLPCGSECGAIRSTEQVAQPIRYKTDVPFSFVGSADCNVVYIYTKCYEMQYADLTEVYQAHPIRYIYKNGYIYVQDGNLCGSITAITDYEDTVAGTVLCVSAEHRLQTGYSITIAGDVSYNGTYLITKVDDDSFYITKVFAGVIGQGVTWNRNLLDTCISVEGAYPLGEVLDDTTENKLNDNIFDDNTALPIPDDLIQAIKMKLIAGELSVTDSKDKIQPKHIDN